MHVRLATGPDGLKSTRILAPIAVRFSGGPIFGSLHTPRQFAYKRNDHYKTHTYSSQNHYSNHISCSHAFNKQRRNGHMRTQTHSLTYGPRVRRFNGHCHYCGKFGHTNYKCSIRKLHLGYGSIWKLDSGMTNPQGPKYIWVPKSV